MRKILFITTVLAFVLFLTNCNNVDKTSSDIHTNVGNEDFISKVSNVSGSQTYKTQGLEINNNSNKPIHLTKKMFLEKIMDYETNPDTWVFKGDKPCIIDFYADWCRPCKMVAPMIDKLVKVYSGKITVYKIDTQVEQELSSAFGIQSIPSFLFCSKKGNPEMFSGIARTIDETEKIFKEKINKMLTEDK